MEPTYNFWVFGDSFGTINDIGYSYHQIKKKYPSMSDRQQLVNSEWPKYIAEHFGFNYDSKFNQAQSGKSADWYLMKLYRMIHKESIRPGDFVLISATAETRFEYSQDISKEWKFNNPESQAHMKTYQPTNFDLGVGDDPIQERGIHPDCLQIYSNLYQDFSWLAHLHLMKHEMVKGYLDNLGISCCIVQSLACRHNELPDNKLNWGEQPNPMKVVLQQTKYHNIKEEDNVEMYDSLKNHFDHIHNKVYAEQLIEYINNG